jgi:hypothetical protein
MSLIGTKNDFRGLVASVNPEGLSQSPPMRSWCEEGFFAKTPDILVCWARLCYRYRRFGKVRWLFAERP